MSISLALAVVAFVRMQLFADGGGVDVAGQQCAARAAIAVFVRKLQRCNCRHLAALHALLKGALRTRSSLRIRRGALPRNDLGVTTRIARCGLYI